MKLKYHNDINKLKLGNLTENETDIFFSLLFKAKETKENIIIMEFSELKALANGDKNNDRFIKNILGLNSKLKALNDIAEVRKGVFDTFSLFGTIRTDTNEKFIRVPIEEEFRYIIHDLMENYTVIDLKQLISLRGNYAKVLYRLLKQWESNSTYLIKIGEFRELMAIPNTYAMFTVRQKVLKPCMDQLGEYFEGLTLEEIKNGRNVSSLKFTWKKKKKEIIKDNLSIKYKPSIGEIEHKKYIEQIQEAESLQDEIIKVTKEKISKNEFEKMVQELMDKNNVKDSFSKRGFEHQLSLKYDVVEDIPQEQEKKVISIDEYKKILRNNLAHNHSFNILEIKEFEKEFFKHTNVKGINIIGDDGGFTLLDYSNLLKW